MAQFLGDIAGMLELFAVAGGLVLLHRAAKEPPAKLLKAAGFVLVVGGIGAGLCTSYYWFKYQSQGVFEEGRMDRREMMRHSAVAPEMRALFTTPDPTLEPQR